MAQVQNFSNKQCLIARDMFFDCLDKMGNQKHRCPDTLQAFLKQCPVKVRRQQLVIRNQEIYDKKLWTQQELDEINYRYSSKKGNWSYY